MEKKFSDPSIKASTSRIIELPVESFFTMEVDLLIATTSRKWANDDDYIVFLGSNDGYESNSYVIVYLNSCILFIFIFIFL